MCFYPQSIRECLCEIGTVQVTSLTNNLTSHNGSPLEAYIEKKHASWINLDMVKQAAHTLL